ncbi:MAG: 2-amino-4-hydroxy-6-hydroxymethyldihydropteridine diphosphokinase [Spirochaetia bacterium]
MDMVTFGDIEISSPDQGPPFFLSGELGLAAPEEGQRLAGFLEIDTMIETAREALTAEGRETLHGGGLESALEEAAEQILIKFQAVRTARLILSRPGGAQDEASGRVGLSILKERHTVYIGIGSNLGDRAANIEKGLELIDTSRHSRVDEVSPLYETDPVGYPDQDKFLNGASRIETLLSPRDLVRFLLEVESALFRERTVPNGPRTIDLDVLFYDGRITSFEEAVIPHPRLHERMFVLKPLTDIAPYHMHPVLGERCYRLKEKLLPEQPEPPVWTKSI